MIIKQVTQRTNYEEKNSDWFKHINFDLSEDTKKTVKNTWYKLGEDIHNTYKWQRIKIQKIKNVYINKKKKNNPRDKQSMGKRDE